MVHVETLDLCIVTLLGSLICTVNRKYQGLYGGECRMQANEPRFEIAKQTFTSTVVLW